MRTVKKIIKYTLMLLLLAYTGNVTAQPYPNTGNHTVCLNSSQPYGVVLNTGSTYQWSVTSLSGGNGTITAGATPNTITVNWTQQGTATLQVIETNATNCASNPVSITVTITALPTATITSNNGPICPGADATFTISGTSGSVVTYNVNGAANQTVTLTGGTATVTVSGVTTNQSLNLVSVTIPSSTCSQPLSGSSTVTVNALPTAAITANNSPICSGNNATFTITGTSGSVVTYSINGGANQTVTLSGGTATVTVPGATTNQTLMLVSVSQPSGGCSQTLNGSSTVSVNTPSTASITANNGPICPGNNATFTLAGTSGSVVTYNINGGANQTVTLTAGTATVMITGATSNQTLNLVSVSNTSGCLQALSSSSTVIVTSTPTASITGNNGPICSGANATFTVTGTSGAVVTYNINGTANQTVTLTGGTATVVVIGATSNQTLNLVSVGNPSSSCSTSLSGSSTVIVNPKPITSPIYHN